MDDLRNEAGKLANEHPDQAGEIQDRLTEIQEVWEDLNDTMKRREESLGEASKLQGFLRDLDDFQTWLSRTQTAVASEDIPTSLPEAESLLAQHESIKNEVDNYKEDYEKMRAVGEEVTQGQTDAQHMFLAQRLQALDTGWHELRRMWENRHSLLAQAFDFQTFLRDAKQAETFLNSQVCKFSLFWINTAYLKPEQQYSFRNLANILLDLMLPDLKSVSYLIGFGRSKKLGRDSCV